ncbi:MAG: carbohydrate ABC transporter permease, partial [Kribbellaceae bacterium]
VRTGSSSSGPDGAPPRPPKRRRTGWSMSPKAIPYLLIIPGLLVIAVLTFYPLYQVVVMAFHKVGLAEIRPRNPRPAEFVGWDNFQQIFANPQFWSTLRNTVLFAVAAVSLTMVVGTLVGILLNQLGRVMSTVVVIGLMLAWGMPRTAVAAVWKWMFDPEAGVVNWSLNTLPDWLTGMLLGRSDWTGYPWFNDVLPIYIVLTAMVVWQSFPFIAVSVLAGLKSVPSELQEAARVDGAGPWTTWWKITFPLLKPIFTVLLVLSVIWDFKVFDQLYILIRTLNRDAANLSIYAYTEAFSSPPRMGTGAAIAIVLTAILMVITCVYVRQIVKNEELR